MQENTAGLRPNVIGLFGAATLGVVMLSPAMTLYGVFGPSFLSAGQATPLAFVWALIATLPTALSYAILSRERPHSGSAASWVAAATNPRFGVWAGWIVFFYYFTNFVIQPVTLGIFFHDLLLAFHLNVPQALSFTAGVLLCCLCPAWMVYRGISVSAHGALLFLLFEAVVVFLLCLTILWVGSHTGVQFSLNGFHISSSPTGTSGLFKAVIFGMLAYCGFDVVSTLAEETKMARRLIPQATLLSLFIYAIFITFGIWCLTYGGNPEHLQRIAEGGRMPITDVAERFWGKGALFVTLTALSATLGLAIATSVGASRILFSMARDGLTFRSLGKLHAGFQVPWNSLHVIFTGGLIGSLVICACIGPYNSYVWWGTTSTFFAMLTYILVNGANLILNRHRSFSSIGAFFLYVTVPVFGMASDGYILYRSFFVELIDQGWATGKSVMAFDGACALLALFFALAYKNRPPKPTSSRNVA